MLATIDSPALRNEYDRERATLAGAAEAVELSLRSLRGGVLLEVANRAGGGAR